MDKVLKSSAYECYTSSLEQLDSSCLIYHLNLYNGYCKQYMMKIFILIICIVCRLFNSMITISSGCFNITRSFFPYCSVMKENSIRMQLTIHEILVCGLQTISLSSCKHLPKSILNECLLWSDWRYADWTIHFRTSLTSANYTCFCLQWRAYF
jgi:hypothetical protein